MSLLRFLGFKDDAEEDPAARTQAVRKIVDALDRIEPQRAKFIAAFSYLLGRVAHADLEISESETAAMEQIVSEKMELPAEQAVIAVQIAKTQARLFGGTEDYLVAREFETLASREQKLALLHCLFAVCAADRKITTIEDNEIRKISGQLRLPDEEFFTVRRSYRDHLAVLKET